MAEIPDAEQFAIALAGMARDLLAQDSVQATLDRIAVHAVELVAGCEAAGIMSVRNGRVNTLTTTDNVARVSDRAQGELGEGPCFDAVDDRQSVYRIADVQARVERWPRYMLEARRIGIGSIMGFLLYTEDKRNLGALNMYSPDRAAFTEASERIGWLLASHAAVALSSARTNSSLHEAIGTRQDIGEALGIVMERNRVSERDAFAALTKASQQHNIKLRDIARSITRTGEVPGDPGAGV